MDSKKIEMKRGKILLISLIGVLTLIAAIAGATYAYFSATVSSGEYISGTSANDPDALTLQITQKSAGTGKMLPIDDSEIQSSVTGAPGKGSCLDENGNTLCKVYSITVTNTSKLKLNVMGEFELTTTKSMPNLKWAKGTTATTGYPNNSNGPFYSSFNTFTSNINTTTQTKFLSDDVLEASGYSGNSKTYYVAIWISTTTVSQGDTGTFNGKVTFSAYTEGSSGERIQGVTSTLMG